jgi:hypothetical protein
VLVALLVGLRPDGGAQAPSTQGPQTAPIGGAYAELDARRQRLVEGWVARFNQVTGLKIEAGPFYDGRARVSAKTTFEAVTHALMTTPLTDDKGARLGDALDLVERIDTVAGQVSGAPSDHQFRMFALLRADAVALLERSREFKRGVDNTVFHRGYPMSFRAQGGPPSIQVSIAPDGRNADVDIDYRRSMFPLMLFNGHLTSANSDVRAGGNYDRHVNRWNGFTNWWRNFFGIRQNRQPDENRPGGDRTLLPASPRAGKKNIDVMTQDFLKAWLVEGNFVAAMGYVSDRAYACMAQDADDPTTFDRGMAPFRLMNNLAAAKEALGPQTSLDNVIAGVRLTNPALKVVTQPHHSQFVLYSVPDDIAAGLDCQNQLSLGRPDRAARVYGTYFGAVFYAAGRGGPLAGKGTSVALLWAREGGYWKIVSWKAEPEDDDAPAPSRAGAARAPAPTATAEPGLIGAAKGFLESWLVRRDYDAAFRYLSPAAYDCYNGSRNPELPAATTSAEAAKAIREAFDRVGRAVGKPRTLDAVIAAVEPVHPAVRVINHPDARAFTLASLPNALAATEGCGVRVVGAALAATPQEYGQAFGVALRFRTKGGEAPVLRLLWLKDGDVWRIAAFDVLMP